MFEDLRHGVRALRKNPAFSLVIVLTIALGIGVNTAIFSAAQAVFLRPLPFPDAERLVWLTGAFPGSISADDNFAFPVLGDVEEQNRVFDGVAAYHDFSSVALTGDGEPLRLTANFVTASYLPLLGAKASLGRLFLGSETGVPESAPVVVISEAFWRTRFGGDPSIVGRRIHLNQLPAVVIGVMAPGFRDLEEPYRPPIDVWIPVGMSPRLTGQIRLDDRNGQLFWGIARLRSGVSLDVARQDLRAIARRLEREHPDTDKGFGLRIYPLRDHLVGGAYAPVRLLLVGSAFVLLIGCVNVANLLLARLVGRRREMAMRAALGGTRLALSRQLLAEFTVLSGVAGALGLGLALVLVRALGAWGVLKLPGYAAIRLDGTMLGASIGLSLVTALLFGLVPALQGGRADLREVLSQGGPRAGGVRDGGRRLLVVAEVSLSMVLLIGAGLMLKSVRRLASTGLNFPTENLLTLRLDLRFERYADAGERARFARELVERTEAIPGVASTTLWGPSNIGNSTWVTFVAPEGRPVQGQDGLLMVHRHSTNPSGLAKLGIPLLSGREFEWSDGPDAAPVSVVSHGLAERFWPNEDAVGKRLQVQMPGGSLRLVNVVGVAADARLRPRFDVQLGSQAFGPQLDLYLPFAQRANRTIVVALRTKTDPASVVAAVRGVVKRLDADLPVFDVRTLSDRLAEEESGSRGIAALMTLYAGAALFLAVLGIYAVLAHGVSQRTHEIGVRMALGAGARDVLRLVLGQGMVWTSVGVGAGLAGALAVTRVMRSLLFDVSATDAGVFAGVAGVFVAVSLAACAVPARRAALVDPLAAIRSE